MEEKIENIENKLNEINNKMIPLLDILKQLIENNIPEKTLEEEEKDISPDLLYKIDSDNIIDRYIYISGKKTFDNKEIIKTKLNGIWDKDNSEWKIRYSEDIINKMIEELPFIQKKN